MTNLHAIIDKKKINIFKKYLKRRAKNEPLPYILEEKEFWSKKFIVSRDTLIPRPETELLVEKLLKMYKDKKISILDIGTGTGCIIVSLLINLDRSVGVGIDISKKAISMSKKKALKKQL